MIFELNGKVAIVTGAASGIGLEITKEFLRNGCKGVTLVDVNTDLGLKVLEELKNEFGKTAVIFVKADVSNFEEFKNAFIKTLESFKNIDILVNNAGIFNDAQFSKEIAINLTGTTNGMILAHDTYLPKHKQGEEGLIINIASIAGLDDVPCSPVYSATKSGIIALTRCWGLPYHYEKNKVKVIAICPGVTTTPILVDFHNKTLGENYGNWLKANVETYVIQEPEHLAKKLVPVLRACDNGTIWVIEGDEPYQYIFPEKSTMKKNKLKQI